MSKVRAEVKHTHRVTEHEVSRSIIRSLVAKLNLIDLFLWDSCFFCTTLEDWGKVFEDVLLGMPKYTTEKFDCENFAMLVSARVSERYRLNTCGVAIGDSPQGRHGFNLFIAVAYGMEALYLEPQTGEVFPLDSNSGYKAEIVIMG